MPPQLSESYAVLELDPSATAEEIKNAYLDLVKVWHPDRYLKESPRLRRKAEEKLKQINLAYERLCSTASGVEEAAPGAGFQRTNGASWNHLEPVHFGGSWGYVNGDGKLVIPPRFDSAMPFSEGLAAVSEAGRFGYIDSWGGYAIYPEFASARCFSEGLAAVVFSVRWGYIDREGRFRINPLYDECADFSEGLAAVRWRGRWGFIDASGAFAIRPRFDSARDFRHGWAEVKLDERWGKTDRNGDVYLHPTAPALDTRRRENNP